MIFAIVIFCIASFVAFRLGYTYGIYDDTRLTVDGLKRILPPEDFLELNEKIKNYAAKSL